MLTPRYYQSDSVNAFFDYCERNHGKHPLIVVPTAGGKSLIQALIIDKMLKYPNVRMLLLTHQQELIKQNASELLGFLDDRLLDVGVYCAGLNSRDTKSQILFASIQSIHKKAWELGFFDLILVDECHRIPQKSIGTYRKFLDEMFKINPKIVIGGLTATAFRMKHGILTEGKDAIFNDICYSTSIPELINPNHFKNRDHKQYLTNIISKSGVNKADLNDVHIRGGEYVQGEMETAFRANGLIAKAVTEIKEYTESRKKVLIFTAGIAHCEEVTEELNRNGLSARCTHSNQNKNINEQNLEDFKSGKYKFLVNVDQYTTGFNERSIDCVILLRATQSPGLYMQMVGRGFRMFPGKDNCLVLDFGKNIERFGPIDKIEIKKNKEGNREVSTAPQKECPDCHSVIALAVMICPDCGHVFPQKDKHEDTASEADILSKWKKPIEYTVESVNYSRHCKAGKPDSLRVEYVCDQYGIIKVSEWICVQHQGFAKKKAEKWVSRVTDLKVDTVEEALKVCSTFEKPIKIIVDSNGHYPSITARIFAPKKSVEQIREEKEAEFDEAVGRLM